MNRRAWQTIVTGILASSLFGTIACAQSAERSGDHPRASARESAAPVAAAAPAAQAPNARLAGLIRRDGKILRGKGITSVQRIAVGVYCITPAAASGVTAGSAIVMVAPEYYYSQFSEIMVQWATQGSGCASSQIGVYTLADGNLNGTFTPSNAVSFSIIVP